ncbi:hypothetical protein PHYBLDRAFT_138093 [Phycomyces blakesleeanus NRRL 1555(-)]|uniref:Uncharacterized protein n=2 Tax=Phycomyces blakesleeanus TaxID=4837 RepID=A0A167QZY8_PHYB8|nr:hypothetical protein PHYBLDRAFT_138093 [Phycomyces blakesleeanus NRRL 1555(-)]OAD80531.1 hypothetical protein PHYBLDRAFT_138093 [Phycomyces blakesleeanus NRRL 1555(-)]|eukprot:XP_018298571.1 hypothetical protein PHYBLDRAFT_138093 [Phycomyces blakesleeanus NRRL 1555(-)]
MVRAHLDQRLFPVHTFQILLQRRPYFQASTLFINSLQTNKPLTARTIQIWISKLIRLSTSEPRVSLRSIASSLALQSDIPKADIVTMGHLTWSTTFEKHCLREHLPRFDFTNKLITSGDDDSEDDSNVEDVLFDAVDSPMDSS